MLKHVVLRPQQASLSNRCRVAASTLRKNHLRFGCHAHFSRASSTLTRLINQNPSVQSYHQLRNKPSARAFSRSVKMETGFRKESDAFGEVDVPADKYWGAQTQRSLTNFSINQPQDRMAPAIVRAFGILKGAAAAVNMQYGLGMSSQPSQVNEP